MEQEITVVKRYIISGIRLFTSTFLTVLVAQLTIFSGEFTTKALIALISGALISAINTLFKWIQENKFIERSLNYIFKKLFK